MYVQVKDEEVEFDWDKGNTSKIRLKHGVVQNEAESVFSDENSLIIVDEKHSITEDRFVIVGKSEIGRNLFIVFTTRGEKIRIISARRMHRREVEKLQKLKRIPRFKSEDEEARFWNRVDSTKYLDWSKAEHWSFPNLRFTSRPVTLRLYESVINRLKIKARKLDMPYQTLMKQYIFKGLGLI